MPLNPLHVPVRVPPVPCCGCTCQRQFRQLLHQCAVDFVCAAVASVIVVFVTLLDSTIAEGPDIHVHKNCERERLHSTCQAYECTYAVAACIHHPSHPVELSCFSGRGSSCFSDAAAASSCPVHAHASISIIVTILLWFAALHALSDTGAGL